MLSVSEARERRVCRVCEQPIARGGPKGWEVEFGRRIYPPPSVTVDFGDEFAHTGCLAPPTGDIPKGEGQEMNGHSAREKS